MSTPQEQGPKITPVKRPKRRNIDNKFLRAIAYDRWFRWTGSLVLAGVVCVGLFISKLFVASEPEVYPPMRISLLDKLQARSLIRAAVRHGRAGDLLQSMTAWRSALANNPANLEVYRGCLETLAALDRMPRDYLNFAYLSGYALLRRGGTNSADVLLFARVLHRADEHRLVAELLAPHGIAGGVEADAMLAHALFFSGKMKEFGDLLRARGPSLAQRADIALVGQAWAAVWGPPAGMHAARAALVRACADPAAAVLANRLQLRVSAALMDPQSFRASLDRLVELHADTVYEQVEWWMLMIRTGRRGEAAELARNFNRAPENPDNANHLARAFDQLGMTAFAATFLSQQIEAFTYADDLWVLRAELLMRNKDWSVLREHAVRMRQEPALSGRLTAFSWFLEGAVDLALNRASSADTSFAAMMDSPFESPELAVRVASRVRDLGRPVLAAEMMKRLESTYGGDAFFWFTLCIAAHEARDIETASRAAAKAYALEPANDVYAHNHAASLITLEQEPEEAVKLTMRLLAAAPRVVDRRINHALALINNRRYYDAEAALAGIDPETLSPEQATEFGFAKFLLLSAAGRADEARRAASRIDRTRLHAVQSERMRRVLEALPK